MKALFLESPERDDEAHSADTREIKLPAALVAKLMEAQEKAEEEAEVAKQTERRRRRENLTTLSRENPFIHPSPLAPWVVVSTPFPARDDDRTTLPAPPLEELLAKRTMKMPKAKRPSAPRPLLEVVVVVWTLMAAVALLAQQLAH